MNNESGEAISSFSSYSSANIDKINHFLLTISDIIHLYVKDICDAKEYEKVLQSILVKITNIKSIPSPFLEFSKFVEFVNENKPVIVLKKETNDVLRFLKASNKNKDMHFLLWEFLKFFDLEIFIDALKSIAHSNDNLYFELFNINQNIDLFFDHYFPTLEFNQIINNDNGIYLKFNLLYIFCKILIDFHDKVNNLYSYQRRIWNYLLNNMKSDSTSIRVESFRTAMYFYKNSFDYLDTKYRYSWLNRMISTTPSDDYLHFFAVKFVLELDLKDFNYVELCKNIVTNNITDVSDFYLINEILSTKIVPKEELNFDFLFKFLFITSTTNKIFSASAMYLLRNLISKVKFSDEFAAWASLFIRRCFQFIVFSLKKNKYNQKRVFVLNFLSELDNLKNDYLCREIHRYASSLLKCSLAEQIIQLKFQQTDSYDDNFIQETQKIKVERVNIKILLDDVFSSIPLIFTDEMDYSYSSYSSDYSDSSTV